MRNIILLMAALCFATVSSADEIHPSPNEVHLATTCSALVSPCSIIEAVTGRPVLDVHFGQFEFKVQDLPTESVIYMPDETDFQVTYTNGGGDVLLLDSSSNVVAQGVFLPGAIEYYQTGIESLRGSIHFSYLNADSLGIGTGIIQGGGSFVYSSDVNDPFLVTDPTNFYDLSIDGNSPPAPTPESSTLLLTLVGVGIFGLVKVLR
jgi:hypothetical protein